MSLVTGQASRSGDNDGLIGIRVAPEDCDAVDVDPEAAGPKLVRGTYVGPLGSVVRKSVVFQIPPLGPATYTVLPDVSDGSTAIALTCPVEPVIGAGPTAVHCSLDKPSVWLSVKIRKLSVALSLPFSPNPEVGSGFWKLRDQPLRIPDSRYL